MNGDAVPAGTRRERLRATAKRRVAWPIGARLVATPAWNVAVGCYAAVTSRLGGTRTDATPLSLRWIDPKRPLRDTLPESPELPPVGRVEGGDWDRVEDRFADRAVPRAIRQRFLEGRAWDETPLPAHVAGQVRRFGDAWGHVDDAVDTRRRAIEALYESIREEGYLTQAEVVERGVGGPGPPPVPVLGEITVDVGRTGQLCWRGYGQHRLAIARVLGVERVPVLVARRHTGWQAIRDRIRRDGFDGVARSRRDHPDLQDLRGSSDSGPA